MASESFAGITAFVVVVVAPFAIVDAFVAVVFASFAIVFASFAVVGTFVVVIAAFCRDCCVWIWYYVAFGGWGRRAKCGLGLSVSVARYYKRGIRVFEWVTLSI